MEINQLILTLGVLGLITWAGVRLLGPFAASLAQRLRHRDPLPVDDSAILALREDLDAVHERLDFMERMIAQRSGSTSALPRPQAGLPPARVPTPV